MTAYYKATGPDGRDFHTGTIDYGAALLSGEVVRHPTSKLKVPGDAGTYLSVSTEPADCTGFRWPCRLFRVEPVGRVGRAPIGDRLPNKRTTLALRVVEELPAHMALGPNGEAVVAFIERCRTMTPEQVRRLAAARATAKAAARATAKDAAKAAVWAAARDAAWAAVWDAAWDAAWAAAWAAVWDAAWDAAWAAAWAIVVRDLITPAQYATLTQPFRDAGLGEWVE